MPVNAQEVGKAMDAFVDDDFVTAKEIIAAQIRGARDEFLQDKLSLKEPEEVTDSTDSGEGDAGEE